MYVYINIYIYIYIYYIYVHIYIYDIYTYKAFRAAQFSCTTLNHNLKFSSAWLF